MPPIGALIGAIAAGVTAVTTAVAGIASFGGLVAFLSSPIGSLILGVGLSLISSLLLRKNQQTPSMEASKVNARIPEGERWISCGDNRDGGSILFAEFDANGNFWYLVAHSDSILVDHFYYYLDDIKVTFDEINEFNQITHYDFILGFEDGEVIDKNYEPDIPVRLYYRIWTTTYTETNPVPPAIQALKDAFPGENGWTDDHKLAGVTYSVVSIIPSGLSHRYKIYRFRGPVGIGEPAISVVGLWSNVYDPRDETQNINNKTTWKPSKNAALVWAWFRTHKYGRDKSIDSINWAKVAEQADICDQEILDYQGNTIKRYECSISIPESKERIVAEQEILISCDGQLVFDDDGKCWMRVGYYETPTLRLSRNRDIVAMESVEAQNGESETQGVIVRYIDPDAKYITNPCAPWVNPLYYVPGQVPKYLTFDALACRNHNQAMRIAKAIGLRSQPLYKILPVVGLRGLRARKERIFNLLYDNTFAGDHEIVTTVEADNPGLFCSFGAVPVDANRWTLLIGEEKPKPVFNEVEVVIDDVPLPTGVVITFVNNQFRAVFDPVPRQDITYEFQFKNSTDDEWLDFVVEMQKNYAYTTSVPQNKLFDFRWRSYTSGGKYSNYSSPILQLSSAVLFLSGTPVTTGSDGVPYAGFTISVTGGISPYIFADVYSRLPDGVTINPASGVVSGTPTTPGTYEDIIIRVLDADNSFANFPQFDITIT